ELGFMRAGPLDLIELHGHALAQEPGDDPRVLAREEEGRLLLVELLGNLASYYRSFAFAANVGEITKGD
ncbi:MAG: hypothetical protein KC910_33005, partial [Candidatus Eremiobacteraeota bacterium]|nr:hypothetical protein [Candidatus Eremiobacteraeota bacterium]